MGLSASTLEARLLTLIALVRDQIWYQKSAMALARPLKPFVGQHEAEQLVKYLLVGIMGMVIELITLNFLIFALGWTSDFQKVAANVFAVSLAIFSNFVWNRLWTFSNARTGNKRKQFARFIFVSIVGLVLNSVIFYLADNYLFEYFFPQIIAIQLAKFVAIGIVLVWNFAANRFWTFNTVSP